MSGVASAKQTGTDATEDPLTRSVRRLLTSRSGMDGRLVLFGAVAAYLAAVVVGRLVWQVDVWAVLGIPPGPSVFFDARNLTAAWECQRLGYDPLYESPCDPWNRPLMYLRPWLFLGVLGLDQSHTFPLAIVLIAAMFLTFGLLVGRVPFGTGVVLALAACSPAVMLAVERGNMDIALFSLVAMSLLLWRVSPSRARVISPMLVLIGATAKLYPVFALPAFVVTRSRVAARTALACITAFGLYCVYSARDIAHVAEIAIQGELWSYGARILPAHLYHQVGADQWTGPAAVKQLLAAAPLGVIAAAIVIRVQRRLGARGDDTTVNTSRLLALHAGALIYLGTFATANNFDYRLVFLFLTLPQLVEWASIRGDRLSSLAAATLVAIVVLLWVGSLSQWLNLWDELASWVVASLLTAVLAATLPSLNSVRRSVLGDVASVGVHP
jgi:hypothetical protein